MLKEIPIPNIQFPVADERGQLYRKIVKASQTLQRLGDALSNTDSIVERTRLERQMNALKREMDAEISILYGVTDVIDRIELPA